jgi:hypothetical protein
MPQSAAKKLFPDLVGSTNHKDPKVTGLNSALLIASAYSRLKLVLVRRLDA